MQGSWATRPMGSSAGPLHRRSSRTGSEDGGWEVRTLKLGQWGRLQVGERELCVEACVWLEDGRKPQACGPGLIIATGEETFIKEQWNSFQNCWAGMHNQEGTERRRWLLGNALH